MQTDHHATMHDHAAHDHAGHDHARRDGTRRRPAAYGPWLVCIPMAAAFALRGRIGFFDDTQVRLWSTLFVSVSVQALPFLVLGVVISGAIAAFVSPAVVQRLVPKRSVFAVPAAGLAGMALPGCECGAVPIAGRLIGAGTPPAAALTFLLAAPAVNPVVLVSTAVAFPNDRMMVVARFIASFAAAVLAGWWWARRDHSALLAEAAHHADEPGDPRMRRFVDVASRDLVHAGGYLIVGAMAAATLQLVVPRSVIDAAATGWALPVITMALLAVLLSICSEADAFVAAGMPQFSLKARLVFLVVGPVVDLKLIALQSGIFGRRFAMVFAPVTFLIAVAAAVIVGGILL